MRRLVLTAIAALLVAAPALAVERTFRITPITIGGANLHGSKRAYIKQWGRVQLGRLEGGYTRLTFKKRHIEVYFKKGKKGAVAIVTWDHRDRTLDKVGPCATVAAFKRAYPNAKPFKQGTRVVAYRLGRLIFTAESKRIGDVMLATPAVSPYVALNAPECR